MIYSLFPFNKKQQKLKNHSMNGEKWQNKNEALLYKRFNVALKSFYNKTIKLIIVHS